MNHLVNTARGRLAKNQDDLLKIAMNQSKLQEEIIEHPISEVGFCVYGEEGLERMTDQEFYRAVLMLMKSRPSARLWDMVPDVPYTEDKFLIESPEAFRMSFEEKAQLLAEEFMRRPKMVGFKVEIHGVDNLNSRGAPSNPSVSFTLYETSDELPDTSVPLSIRTVYRTNF